MILKGKQRADGRQLGFYLLKIDKNEHVEVHEVRGFMSDELPLAFGEIDAISKGTRATQPFFSLSLNPPPNERVSVEEFETAIEQIEQKLSLANQPRAIVFHEQGARRHAHVVWSRIDTDKMTAINLPHFKLKLRDVSRNLFLQHGWKMPPGLMNRKDRNPLNFSREEWQQSRRAGLHPKDVKRIFQESWAASDSRKAFAGALWSQGFVLARGDRRGYVALDYQGEIYAIAKYTGIRTKAVKERLGDPQSLPSIDQAKAQIAKSMSVNLKSHLQQAKKDRQRLSAAFEFKRKQLVDRQRAERQKLEKFHQMRWETETNERAKRLSGGLKGIWHRLTGKYAKAKHQNEQEALLALQRDRKEKDELIFGHIEQRQQLNLRQRREQHRHNLEIEQIRQDIHQYREMKSDNSSKLRDQFRKASEHARRTKTVSRDRDRYQDHGFEPEI